MPETTITLQDHERSIVAIALQDKLTAERDRFFARTAAVERNLIDAATATLVLLRRVSPGAAEGWMTVHGDPLLWSKLRTETERNTKMCALCEAIIRQNPQGAWISTRTGKPTCPGTAGAPHRPMLAD